MQCLSVAAASIIAKVERDAMMCELHTQYPAYGWDVNKGYGTAAHKEALRTCRSHAVPPGQLAAALTGGAAVGWPLGATAGGARPAPDGARWNHECRGP